MNERILMIETSTECCSAALSCGDRIIAKKIGDTPKIHAAMLAPFIAEILGEASLTGEGFDAVAVSKGPGSYTGLRVGVSTAKGICFGSGKPLIAIDTLQILAMQAEGDYRRIIPMIDARRMEVYTACYDSERNKLDETRAVILDENSFSEELGKGKVLFIGNGAGKFSSICHHSNASFISCCPLAEAMVIPALKAYKEKEFEDVAYFEPFYLKEFVAGISKKSVL